MADVIAGLVTEAAAARDELSTIAKVLLAPPLPFLPEACTAPGATGQVP